MGFIPCLCRFLLHISILFVFSSRRTARGFVVRWQQQHSPPHTIRVPVAARQQQQQQKQQLSSASWLQRPIPLYSLSSSSRTFLSSTTTSTTTSDDVPSTTTTTRLQSEPSPSTSNKTSNSDSSSEADSSSTSSTTTSWLHCGLLLSSFQQGLLPCLEARRFLRHGLVECLLNEELQYIEARLAQSAALRPCCGPDVRFLNRMEAVDAQIALQKQKAQSDDNEDNDDDTTTWQSSLQLLLQRCHCGSTRVPIRFVYIPTALYALRSDSNNTPGKQRQRARADGKKRRNEMVRLLHDIFTDSTDKSCGVEIHAVTVDLDDGSVKQPEISESLSSSANSPPPPPPTSSKRSEQKGKDNKNDDNDNVCAFPSNGRQALSDWNPHLIYVEGGNTFWLHHCLEKGDWRNVLMQRISSSLSQPTTATTKDEKKSEQVVPAVYCGNSAGAILLGASVETACWKGWDDPSVVPSPIDDSSSNDSMDSSCYDDWKGIQGLNLLGGQSVFPHYEEETWGTLVQEEAEKLAASANAADNTPSSSIVQCVRDQDVICVQNGKLWTVSSDNAVNNNNTE